MRLAAFTFKKPYTIFLDWAHKVSFIFKKYTITIRPISMFLRTVTKLITPLETRSKIREIFGTKSVAIQF